MWYRLGNPYTLALLVATAVVFGLAAAALRHRQKRAGRTFFVFLVGIGLWSLADAMRYAAPTGSTVLLWNRVGYLGIVMTPPALLLFVFSYTGRDRWVSRRSLAVLFGISAAAYAVVLTNPLHGLWFEVAAISPGTTPPVLQEDWGLAWYGWAVYSYALVLVSLYLMSREFLVASRSGTHRGQTGLVLAGILIAGGVNLLFIFDLVSFDPAPFVFAVTGVCFGVAMFRYQLLTLLPVARDTVVANMDSGVLVLDSEGRLVDANDRAKSMFEIGASDALGAPAENALVDVPEVRDRLAAGRFEEPVTVADGDETRHYDIETSELTDALGTHVGRIVVFSDITERVNQQRRLRERTNELERTNDQLDQFASVVSHDLRNPLNIITGRVALAREDDHVDQHLVEIDDAAGQMEALIDDLLTLARQGRAVGETGPIQLDAVAREAWALTGYDADRLTCETEMTVEADPERLQEALGNLFRNSVEHGETAADGGRVSDTRVHIRVGELADGFFVEDDGPGIPEADRDQVFEPGYTTNPEGTGFGLNIVREIVRAHDWRVDVTDGRDGGARFEVRGVETG